MKFDAESRRKAQESRKANLAAAQHYKRDWLDSPVWEEMARLRGVRLPTWTRVPTSAALKRWHRTLDKEPFLTVYACSPKRLIALNPHTPLRAFVGQMLERVA